MSNAEVIGKEYRKVYIADANKIQRGLGRGVFAKVPFRRGERIFLVTGKEFYLDVHNKKQAQSYPLAIGVSHKHWLNPNKNNPLVYLNHSCEPNAGIRGKRNIVALRRIQKDEHITIDYSTTEEDTLWSMRCRCGSKHCRKIIRSIQSLPKKRFAKYIPYISTYFKNLYMKQVQ